MSTRTIERGAWVRSGLILRWEGARPTDDDPTPRTKTSPVSTDEILELVDRGLTDQQIGDVLGMTVNAISKRRQRAGVGKRKAPSHGTDSGYKRHLREGERACDDCLEAHRQQSAKTNARRKLKRGRSK